MSFSEAKGVVNIARFQVGSHARLRKHSLGEHYLQLSPD